MKFYLSSAQDWEPYDNLNTNKLMKGYCSYSDLVDDLKSRLDHVEKVHNPRLLVGGDDDD